MRNQTASVLIMVVLMLALMVSMAIGFLSIVGRQLGSAINIASQTKADVAVHQAQAHVIRAALQTADQPTLLDGSTNVDYTTMFNPRWRAEFSAVTDPDGDPFTNDGLSMPAGTKSSPIGSATEVSDNPITNARYNLFDMVGADTERDFSVNYGFAPCVDRYDSADNMYISRWHNVEYMDEEFQHIEIDPSLSEADKAILRKSARYVVRYMAQVMDVNGMMTINNNFPVLFEDGTSIVQGNGAVDNTQYIRYQNYLRCYGRSIKSAFGSMGGLQYRSDDDDFLSADPLDKESSGYFVDGQQVGGYYSGSHNTDYDARKRIERAFRNGDLQWMNGGIYDNVVLTSAHKGRAYTFGNITESFLGNPIRTGAGNIYTFVPYGDSMIDSTLADPDLVAGGHVNPSNISTPWRVNVLSAPNTTIGNMVFGLSSELRFYKHFGSNPYGPTLKKTTGGTSANVDLLGKVYPEAFPLSLDAGRDVPCVGDGMGNDLEEAPWYYQTGHWSKRNGSFVMINSNWGNGLIATNPGYQNSYYWDIVFALTMALRDARQAWIVEGDLRVDAEVAGPTIYEYQGGVNNSYIDKNEHDPEDMLNLILSETYRVLGEGRIISGTPATSEDYYNAGQESLLSGGSTFCGAGSNKFYQRKAKLPPTANTRGMEYVLNDIMISLFGKANPHFDLENDPLSENIAVDFNGDGYAESTVTGWYDAETNGRVWSWWWDGLGPYVNVAPQDAYMKEPGWYRFDGAGAIQRKVGEDWVAIANTTTFTTYNDMWLTGNNQYPIKPIAKTGRFFIGKSKIIHGFVRGEVFNLLTEKTLAATSRNFAYHVDPNDDGDFSDSHILIQSDTTLVPKKH